VARHDNRKPELGIDGCRVCSCAQSPYWVDCTMSTRSRRQLRPCSRSRLAAKPLGFPVQSFNVGIPRRRDFAEHRLSP
jgi:hypothetical protein